MILGAIVMMAAALGAPAAFADGPRQPAPVPTTSDFACLRVLTSVAAGKVPAPADYQRVVCPPRRPAPAFRYDTATQSTRTMRPLAQSEVVPIFSEFSTNLVLPGQVLQLVTQSGPVRIVRQVEAMQAARSGERLFVKSNDGQIFSARYEAASP
jgi:hypothetical protein